MPDATEGPKTTPIPEAGENPEPPKEEDSVGIFGLFTEEMQEVMGETVQMFTRVLERVEMILRNILRTVK